MLLIIIHCVNITLTMIIKSCLQIKINITTTKGVKMNQRTFSIIFDEALIKKCEQYGKIKDWTRSQVIRNLVKEKIKELENQGVLAV